MLKSWTFWHVVCKCKLGSCRTVEWLLMAQGATTVKDHPVFLHALGEPRATEQALVLRIACCTMEWSHIKNTITSTGDVLIPSHLRVSHQHNHLNRAKFVSLSNHSSQISYKHLSNVAQEYKLYQSSLVSVRASVSSQPKHFVYGDIAHNLPLVDSAIFMFCPFVIVVQHLQQYKSRTLENHSLTPLGLNSLQGNKSSCPSP